MWLVPTEILCRKHLMGEHLEMHMFLGSLQKNKKIDGFLKNNLFEPTYLFQRHQELKEEIIKRGYNHKSEMTVGECKCVNNLSEEQKFWKIDRLKALEDLITRCPKCLKRYQKFMKYRSF